MQDKVLAAADDNLAAAVERMERRAEEEAMYGGDRRGRQVCAPLVKPCYTTNNGVVKESLNADTKEQG